MGILILIILSCFFGWCFTENVNRRCEALQLELAKLRKQHEREKQIWKRTVEELLES